MTRLGFLIILSAAVPMALLVFGSSRGSGISELFEDSQLLLLNLLYMVIPHLVVLTLAALFPAARGRFLTWGVVVLSTVLVTFQFWIWWWVPARESGLAWVLYLPLSGLSLAMVAIGLRFGSKRDSGKCLNE